MLSPFLLADTTGSGSLKASAYRRLLLEIRLACTALRSRCREISNLTDVPRMIVVQTANIPETVCRSRGRVNGDCVMECALDDSRFDREVILFGKYGNRRSAIGALALALGLAGFSSGSGSAAKNTRKKGRKRVCLDGETKLVSRRARKRLLKKGAVDGPCPTSPSSPPASPPPVANKQYTQPCTPGVDVCASPSICDAPSTEAGCQTTVANWAQGSPYICCAPLGAACTECGCCYDLTCGPGGTCQLMSN